VTLGSEGYPGGLLHLKSPPKQLTLVAAGAVVWPKKSIAVIGSRLMSDYGRNVVLDFVPRLVKQGLCIVSGMAEGVDAEAQQAALKAGGQTIGVLGFGIARLTSFSNLALCKRVAVSGAGCLVSPFEAFTTASKYTFLERNKIIAGLADAILVIEASRKSGCMSTVDAALELGKEAFAVPGNVFSYLSMGTNDLIKQGAKPVTCVEDIVV